MASITVEIVSKTQSEAGTTFVLAASEEEIKSAGFVPYFVDQYFQGTLRPNSAKAFGCATPYGTVVLGPEVQSFYVCVLPFVPELTEGDIDTAWLSKNRWLAYKLEKTAEKPNGTYQPNPLTPSMSVGDTLVYYDTKPADPT